MLFKEKYLKLENKEPKKCEQTMTNHEKRITKNEEEVKMLKNTEKECPEKRFKCNKCNEDFKSKGNLKMHIKENHQVKLQCDLCNEQFKSYFELEQHMKEEHDKPKMFKCDVCVKEFHLEWRLLKHKEGHSKTLKYCHFFNNRKFCPYEENGCMFRHDLSPQCFFGKKCSNSLCQFRHETIQKEKQFPCIECDYKAPSSSQLEMHVRTWDSKRS